MKRIIKNFIKGIVFIAPLVLTGLLFFYIFNWVETILEKWHVDHYIIFGILISLVLITFVGYLGSTLILKPFSDFFNKIINRIPILNFVYRSLKDMTHALVGDKNKFSNPVLIQMGKDSDIYRVGFLTQPHLNQMGMKDMVSVFVPISYSYTGNMYVVPKERVTPVNAAAVDVFKLIFTGGLTAPSDKSNSKILLEEEI